VRKFKLLLFGVVLTALLAVPGAAMAKSRDRDHDKLPDKWEKKFHLSTHHKSAKGDPDKDGLNNRGEFRSRTNPRNADSDNDGVNDATDDQDNDGVDNADEMNEGTNPRDRDTDNDGVGDGEEVAGTIVSFVEDSANPGTGVLTIKLADESTISGKVDSTTEIECKTAGGHGDRHDRNGADDGPSHDVGDDHGEHGDDDQHCTTADLTAGTAVHEAELTGTGADAVFREVKLLK
jgi:Bacterial TSP3 repeat